MKVIKIYYMILESLCYDIIRRYIMKVVENYCIFSLLVNDGYINIYKDKQIEKKNF